MMNLGREKSYKEIRSYFDMKKGMIYLGADHAGFALKEKIKRYLDKHGLPYTDLSPRFMEGDDYPSHAFKVAHKVARNKGSRGILMCGSGTGMVIAANRVRGVRAVEAYDLYSAKMSRHDNDVNVLTLRGRKSSLHKNLAILQIWLSTPFSGIARHARRVRALDLHG